MFELLKKSSRGICLLALLTVVELVLVLLPCVSSLGSSGLQLVVKSRATLEPVEGATVVDTEGNASLTDSVHVPIDTIVTAANGEVILDAPREFPEGLEWTITHPDFETLTVNVWRPTYRANSPSIVVYLEPNTEKYLEEAPRGVFKVRFEYKLEEKSLFGRTEIETIVGLRQGDEFGFPIYADTAEVRWPFKVVNARDRNFTFVEFTDDVAAMKAEKMQPAIESPLKVDRLGDCFMYKSMSVQKKLCLHVID